MLRDIYTVKIIITSFPSKILHLGKIQRNIEGKNKKEYFSTKSFYKECVNDTILAFKLNTDENILFVARWL